MTKTGFTTEIRDSENILARADNHYRDDDVIEARKALMRVQDRIRTLLTLTAEESRQAHRAAKKARNQQLALDAKFDQVK